MTNEPDRPSESPPRSAFQFSLRDLLGLMVVAAIILAATVYYWEFVFFGIVGAVFVLAVGVFYLAVPRDRNTRKAKLGDFVVLSAVVYVVLCALAPGCVDPNWVWKRSLCCEHVKRIVLALHHYHDEYGTFPPAYVADENGRAMHSWRVLILPFMEQQGLYDQYDFSEPWNGPNNRKLLSALPDEFRCPEQRGRNTSETNYVAVIGPRTAWTGTEPMEIADFVDDPENIIMLVEVVDSGIAWTAPQDLTLKEALEGLPQNGGRAIASHHQVSSRLLAPTGAVLGYADWHAEFLADDYPKEVWRALLQRDDGKPTVELP